MNLIHSNDGMDVSKESLQASHNDRQIDFPPIYDNDNDEANLEHSSESVLKEIETNVLMDMNEEEGCTTCSDDVTVVFNIFLTNTSHSSLEIFNLKYFTLITVTRSNKLLCY